jgi:hypothetical protein
MNDKFASVFVSENFLLMEKTGRLFRASSTWPGFWRLSPSTGSLDKRGRCAYVPTPSGTAALSIGVIATICQRHSLS